MASVAFLLLFLFSTYSVVQTSVEHSGRRSDEKVQSMAEGTVVRAELWCVATNNAEDSALQAALDWACGLGGADCRPIQQGGACFEPNDIQFHASYAFNDYYLRNGVSKQACDFGGTAALISLNPGTANCRFSSSSSARNGSFTGSAGGPVGPDISDGGIGAGSLLSPALAVAFALAAAIA